MKICGLDEAGRGALAGPLVAALVFLPNPGLTLGDSKLLNRKQRERCFGQIMESGAEVSVEIISVRSINNRGISWANEEIFKRLIRKIPADMYIVDGNLNIRMSERYGVVKSQIGADGMIPCVMAAGIVAKVTRDKIMSGLHVGYPSYDWQKNFGYGTRTHIKAINAHGVTCHHRDVYVTTALKNSVFG